MKTSPRVRGQWSFLLVCELLEDRALPAIHHLTQHMFWAQSGGC